MRERMGAEEARIAADSIEEGKRLVRVQTGGLSLADRLRVRGVGGLPI